MQKSTIKKSFVLGIIVMFICLSTTTSTGNTIIKKASNPILNGKTLYVGGSGEGNYTKIQDAIDDANDGDTVFVYNGVYQQGTIRINKTINLNGENKSKTIIDGCGQTYTLYLHDIDFGALFIELSGFTIQNASDVGIFVYSYENTIRDNIVQNNYIGIALARASNNLLYGNEIKNNYYGIFTLGSHVWNNIIERNIIEDNSCGLRITDEASSTLIHHNTIINNENYGIMVDDSYYTTVEKNNIFGNHQDVSFKYFEYPGNLRKTFVKLRRNYWGSSQSLPKFFSGKIGFIIGIDIETGENIILWIRWIEIDWHPAREPYDINDINVDEGIKYAK